MANQKKIQKYTPASGILTAAFVVICLVWIIPIFEVVTNSLKSNNAINLDVFALPNADSFVGFANYVTGMTFGNYPFMKSAGYSVFISVASTGLIRMTVANKQGSVEEIERVLISSKVEIQSVQINKSDKEKMKLEFEVVYPQKLNKPKLFCALAEREDVISIAE